MSTSRSHQILELTLAIKPLLAGQPPDIQGAALADLTAIWLCGHPPDVREPMLDFQCRMIRKFIPVNDQIMFGIAGHPSTQTDN